MDADPWNWDVAGVQRFFQQDAVSCIADRPTGQLPRDLNAFSQMLAENDVDGASLLDYVTNEILKTEFGLSSLRVRASVMHCIRKLQLMSRTYQSTLGTVRPQTPTSMAPTPVMPLPFGLQTAAIDALPSTETLVGDEVVGENVRSGEVQVEDEHGRKRRKLDLSGTQPAPEMQEAHELQLDESSYLPDAPMAVDELFFGPTALGGELKQLLPTGNVLVGHYDPETADDNFQHSAQGKRSGEIAFAYDRMRHFLSNPETAAVRRRDHDAIAILPYPQRLQNKARSALVVQVGKDDDYIATREQASLLQSGYDYSGVDQSSTGEWDFLLAHHKHTASDKELPAYGDSETGDAEITDTSEGGTDLEEAAEEADETLNSYRIAEVVDECVDAHAQDWKERKLPVLEEKRAWSEWRKMKNSRTMKDLLISSAQAKIERLAQRLHKLKQELVEREWSSESAVTKACGNLEPTIEDREEQRWLLTVYDRQKEPAHTVQHRATAGSARAVPTPATEKPPPSFTVHAEDRMSVSPTPAQHAYDLEQPGDDEEDEFHSASGSPAAMPAAGADGFEASDEMSLDGDQSNHDLPPIVSSSPPPHYTPSVMSANGSSKKATPRNSGKFADPHSTTGEASGMSDSQDLPSPSQFITPFIKPETPAKARFKGTSNLSPIEIGSSDTSQQPSAKSKRGRNPKTVKREPIHGPPEEHTVEEVDSWDWDQLAQDGDRMRILIKMLREAGQERRDRIFDCFQELKKIAFEDRLRTAVRLVGNGQSTKAKLPLAIADTMESCARLALAWYASSKEMMESGTSDMPWAQFLQDRAQAELFLGQLRKLLTKKGSRLFVNAKPSQKKKGSSSVIAISDSDTDIPTKDAPHKKRKRQVAASQPAAKARNAALARQDQYREAMESQHQAADSSQLAVYDAGDPSKSEVTINPVRDDEEHDPIFVHPKVAKRMKAHQIVGVRFLWREVTADDEDGGQGCVLAHVMGLGKTLQAIALLVAIVEASESKAKRVYSQLPAHLRPKGIKGKRHLRMLILAPPSLLQNWKREIETWAPKNKLGNIFSVAAGSKEAQLRELEDWHSVGGVLLIGYTLFRNFVTHKGKTFDNVDGARLEEMLLQGPELVVADEAHNIKNRAASTSLAASRIATGTRIALTGTPMSNNVKEIYALVSWVAPGYLGDPAEFNDRFTIPIEDGMYEDSNRGQVRRSLKKLHVLHREIEPKINRADISALRGSLKTKIEFNITVSLTDVQTTLYRRYVEALVGGNKNEKAGQMDIFSWLGVLMLLTNHPEAFRKKLLAPAPKKKKKQQQDAREGTPAASDSGSNATSVLEETTAEQVMEAEAQEFPGEADLYSLGFTKSIIDDILQDVDFDADPMHSAKMSIFLRILEESSRCGDKVLVFSGSIPTIRYLEELFGRQKMPYGKIDGGVSMPKRMKQLEDFHNDKFDVMVVSTKAGGVGLNIQGANRVVLMDFGFNPAWEEQAIGRAYRLGQTKPVFVYRFVAGGTFESNIYNKQLFKTSLSSRVVDKKNPRRNAQRNTRDYLYEPKPVKQQNIMQWQGKDISVLDKILQKHEKGEDSLIRAIQTMETLQEDAEDEPLNEEEKREVDAEIEFGRQRRAGIAVPPGSIGMPGPSPSTAPNGLPSARSMGPPSAGGARPAHLPPQLGQNMPAMPWYATTQAPPMYASTAPFAPGHGHQQPLQSPQDRQRPGCGLLYFPPS